MGFSRHAEGGARVTLPLLPLRDIILFPHMVVPLFVGRKKSIAALRAAEAAGGEILLSAQRRAKTNDPLPEDLFEIGTIGEIQQIIRLPDETVKVMVRGRQRARILSYRQSEPYFEVVASPIQETVEYNQEIAELMGAVRTVFAEYEGLNRRTAPDVLSAVQGTDDPSRLADLVIAALSLKLDDKQQILETDDPAMRLQRLQELMRSEIDIMLVERKIRHRVREQVKKSQREYYQNEQNQGTREQGQERDEFRSEMEELEERVTQKPMPDATAERVRKELRKLKMMSPMSAEATVVRNYIDWVLSLPWEETTDDNLDIERAEAILDEDHYGLAKPKERILEYLSVHRLVKAMRGPILCFAGPPGVGKTSLARSIARSMGRQFVRISLGGVRDEAEIRGHRRTYVGALPGKIVQGLKKAGSINPVILLDEIDKMSMDFRGDPSSALLEVLDPEQNNAFNDHYLDLDYDLSRVMFITTANSISQIPLPLKDRMEIIEVPGYTDEEKLSIAKAYLVRKQLEANGLQEVDVRFADSALENVIRHYTRESGVRNLEREIASICRKVAREHVTDTSKTAFKVNKAQVTRYLGPERFRSDMAEERDEVGLTNGLAWTAYGGVLLTAEVTLMPGAGKLIITGKLGDVMQESAQAALSYVRSRAPNLGLAPNFYQKIDIHVHFPEGAAPKDGPSAGITMVTSLVSALTRIPVRREVAMTGEITLRGRVLPIGGVKEKALAAFRAGVRVILIPEENMKDLDEVPKNILRQLEVLPMKHMDQVLEVALRHDDPAAFAKRLARPLLGPDLRDVLDSQPATVETKHGGMGESTSMQPM